MERTQKQLMATVWRRTHPTQRSVLCGTRMINALRGGRLVHLPLPSLTRLEVAIRLFHGRHLNQGAQ